MNDGVITALVVLVVAALPLIVKLCADLMDWIEGGK
jgi:hypothetical protein